MSVKYPYLQDNDFLLQLAEYPNQEQIVKITALNFNERPIKSIEGQIQSGSINIDGKSAVRRTANLNVIVQDKDAAFMKKGGIFSQNKKVKIEIGIKNPFNKYSEYPILWFPQGVYAIVGISLNNTTSGLSVSLQLRDKMVFLNGECGGTITAAATFNEYDVLNPETGEYVIEYPTIVQIIRELVNHFGGEQLGKIMINDIDTRIKRVMKWTKSYPLYAIMQNPNSALGDTTPYYIYQTMEPPGKPGIDYLVYESGYDVGYTYTDFYFPGELVGNAGDTVCTILDKIKAALGNFEYFYDLDGNFVFQEVKNYLNTTKASFDLTNLNNQDYIVDKGKGDATYVFNESPIIISCSSSPQYNMIKNDYVVWGLRKTASEQTFPIRYHLAIDEKPKLPNQAYDVIQLKKYDGTSKSYSYSYRLPIVINADIGDAFPKYGETDRFYKYTKNNSLYFWDSTRKSDITSATSYLPEHGEYENENGTKVKYTHYHSISGNHLSDGKDETAFESFSCMPSDWRTQLFLEGTQSTRFGTDANYYYTELSNEWPKLYDIKKGEFRQDVIDNSTSIDFFLDFIDTDTALSEFSIENIGRRSVVINDDKINCIFEPPIPDVVFINQGLADIDKQVLRNECLTKKQAYSQVPAEVFDGLAQGGMYNSAYNKVRDLLYQHTQYNENISLSMIPIFYLQPNTRITIHNAETGVHGDYIINSISLPLDINGQMSLSCSKAAVRI